MGAKKVQQITYTVYIYIYIKILFNMGSSLNFTWPIKKVTMKKIMSKWIDKKSPVSEDQNKS